MSYEAREFASRARTAFADPDGDRVNVLVRDIYARGATRVTVDDFVAVGGRRMARTLVVELPPGEGARLAIMDVVSRYQAHDGPVVLLPPPPRRSRSSGCGSASSAGGFATAPMAPPGRGSEPFAG